MLPIGGLKEKALAAQRAGITRVIAPRRNEPDLEDLPEHLRGDIEFVWAAEVEDVLDAALEPAQDGRAPRGAPPGGSPPDSVCATCAASCSRRAWATGSPTCC